MLKNWRRIERPDLEEYHADLPTSLDETRKVEVWWDDQPGVRPGWCIRWIATRYGRSHDQDIPICGLRRGHIPRNIKESTLQAHVRRTLRKTFAIY